MYSKRITWRNVLVLLLLAGAIGGLWVVLPPQPRYVIRLPEQVCCWDFSPDGTLLAALAMVPGKSAECKGPVRLWDAATGQERGTYFQNDDRLGLIWFCPDGKLLVTKRDREDRETLYDVTSGQPCLAASGWNGSVSPDGRLVAFATEPRSAGKVMVWEITSGHEVGTFGAGMPLWFSPDAHCLLTSSLHSPPPGSTNRIRLWSVPKAAQEGTLEIPPGSFGVSFSQDGRYMIAPGPPKAGGRSLRRVVDLPTGLEEAVIRAPAGALFAPDGRTLVGFSKDAVHGMCIKRWDSETWQDTIVAKLDVPGSECQPLSFFAPRGKTLPVSVDYQTPSAWGRLIAGWPRLSGWLPTMHFRREFKLLDAETGEQLGILPLRGFPHLSPDGKLLAVDRRNDRNIEVWDVPPRKAIGPFLLMSADLSMLVLVIAQWRSRRRRQANRLANAAEGPGRETPAPSSATL